MEKRMRKNANVMMNVHLFNRREIALFYGFRLFSALFSSRMLMHTQKNNQNSCQLLLYVVSAIELYPLIICWYIAINDPIKFYEVFVWFVQTDFFPSSSPFSLMVLT